MVLFAWASRAARACGCIGGGGGCVVSVKYAEGVDAGLAMCCRVCVGKGGDLMSCPSVMEELVEDAEVMRDNGGRAERADVAA